MLSNLQWKITGRWYKFLAIFMYFLEIIFVVIDADNEHDTPVPALSGAVIM